MGPDKLTSSPTPRRTPEQWRAAGEAARARAAAHMRRLLDGFDVDAAADPSHPDHERHVGRIVELEFGELESVPSQMTEFAVMRARDLRDRRDQTRAGRAPKSAPAPGTRLLPLLRRPARRESHVNRAGHRPAAPARQGDSGDSDLDDEPPPAREARA